MATPRQLPARIQVSKKPSGSGYKFFTFLFLILLLALGGTVWYAQDLPAEHSTQDTLVIAQQQHELWSALQKMPLEWPQDSLQAVVNQSVVPDTLQWQLTPSRKHYALTWTVILEPLPPDSTRLYLNSQGTFQAPLLRLGIQLIPSLVPHFKTTVLNLIEAPIP